MDACTESKRVDEEKRDPKSLPRRVLGPIDPNASLKRPYRRRNEPRPNPAPLNPGASRQRLYKRRNSYGLPKVKALLRHSAFILLGKDDRRRIFQAAKKEIYQVVERKSRNQPRGLRLDYWTIAHNAVCKIFLENLACFAFLKVDGEESLVSELMDLPKGLELPEDMEIEDLDDRDVVVVEGQCEVKEGRVNDDVDMGEGVHLGLGRGQDK